MLARKATALFLELIFLSLLFTASAYAQTLYFPYDNEGFMYVVRDSNFIYIDGIIIDDTIKAWNYYITFN